MSYRSTMPLSTNKRLLKQYTNAVESMTALRDHIKKIITGAETDGSLETDDDEAMYQYLKMKVELQELEAKISVQQYHKELYEARVEEYLPFFERDSAETNSNFDEVWEKAIEVATKYPKNKYAIVVGMIVNGYKTVLDDKSIDVMTKQELKNDTYKSLKVQTKAILDEVNASGMSVVSEK